MARKKKFIVAYWDINMPRNSSTRICEGVQSRDEAIEELLANDVDVDDITVVEVARMLKVVTTQKISVVEDED